MKTETDGRKKDLEPDMTSEDIEQIADIPNSYVVQDDVEVGIGNKIPLWLFGFLY